MAYNSDNLSALIYANGFTRWHYKTPDDLDQVLDPSYFNGAAGMLRVGDRIDVNCEGQLLEFGDIVVAYNSNGVVETVEIGSACVRPIKAAA